MAQPSVQGRFIWEALLAEDGAAVTPFYAKVLGWRAQAWPVDSKVTIFAAASGPVASMTPMTDERRAQGARSQWLPFIGADDVDAMVASAEKLGAKVRNAAADVGQVGRYAVLTDPQGAAFALFKPSQSSAPKGVPQHGEYAWQELATTDSEAAFDFYRGLFGWQLIHRMDMGAMGFYLIFGSDGVQRGGMFKQSHATPGPFWLPYTSVPDADKAAAAASKSGGHLLNGPMDVPGGGRIAQLSDPKGVPFAVHSMAASSTPPPASSAPASSTPKAATPAPKPAASAPKPAAPTPKAAAPAPKPAAPAPAPAKAATPAVLAKPAAAAPKKKAAARKAAKPKARKAAKKVARKAVKKAAASKTARKSVARSARKKGGKKKAAARRVVKKARRGGKARRKK